METVFKIILIVVYTVFSIIRIQYQVRAQRAGFKTVIEESKRYSVFLSLLICYEVLILFIYLLGPHLLYWANLPFPMWVRWLGLVLALASLAMFIWVHQHLGNNFSMKLRIKESHTLIISGPYQWIRHPMYTAFYLLHFAAFLLTANWFIGLSWLLGLTIIIYMRISREESMMLDKFGEDYRVYMKRTGMFTPSIKLGRPFGNGNK
jgi:protein-S-isoprenylcysteine O-methyltransferase Ste14